MEIQNLHLNTAVSIIERSSTTYVGKNDKFYYMLLI